MALHNLVICASLDFDFYFGCRSSATYIPRGRDLDMPYYDPLEMENVRADARRICWPGLWRPTYPILCCMNLAPKTYLVACDGGL